MRKKSWPIENAIAVLALVGVLCLVVAGLVNRTVFFIQLPLVVVAVGLAIIYIHRIKKRMGTFLKLASENIGVSHRDTLSKFPIPAFIAQYEGEILWYNDIFKENVLQGEDIYGCSYKKLIPGFSKSCIQQKTGFDISYNKREYTVYTSEYSGSGKKFLVFYFIDDTYFKYVEEEYKASRPSVMLFVIDNLEESFQEAKESEKIQMMGEIESLMESFIGATNGFLRKIDRERFIAVVEERHTASIIENRFDILDKTRKIDTHGKLPITLSIGVGRGGKDLKEDELFAQQALDMALGRGGDQAAVKTGDDYTFFGGISQGVEKRTKIKTRVMANALTELIEASSNIIIMGHRSADLDCLGSAAGMAKCVSQFGKSVKIAIRPLENLATALYKRLRREGYEDIFIHPDEAIELVDEKTLLIIVDTHNPKVVESFPLYQKVKKVAVIDHHRKMVNFIDNAVLFYHEPFASSASEMVAELTQYIGSQRVLGTVEAEALMAGIMLDTKNFSMKAGVRTFEAAAYLRRLGADTVQVRKLFANSIQVYQIKSNLVSSAEMYKNCAIAICDTEFDEIMVIAAQAADDLLNISNVEASFVIYKNGNTASVSARSLGDINVQLIMEKLGGGGHQTMAGAQIADADTGVVRQNLIYAIDEVCRTEVGC